nr:glutathione S-transferase class-mu 26 kDa isozyme 1-like [Dermacentor andersoni]
MTWWPGTTRRPQNWTSSSSRREICVSFWPTWLNQIRSSSTVSNRTPRSWTRSWVPGTTSSPAGSGHWGGRLTYVDFLLYEGLDWHREFKAETLQRYPHIVEYLKRFEELPNIKEYFASGRHKKWPISSHLRKWGFKKPSEGHE